LRLFKVQPLHHFAVDLYHTLSGILRTGKCVDHSLCSSKFRGTGAKRRIGGIDLLRVFAGEPHLAGGPAFVLETGGVAKIIVDAVKRVQSGQAGRQDDLHQPGLHEGPSAGQRDTGILGQVVGAHNETVEAAVGPVARFGYGDDIGNGPRRFDHCPQPDIRSVSGENRRCFEEIGQALHLGQKHRIGWQMIAAWRSSGPH
jgi:hypothetical protein